MFQKVRLLNFLGFLNEHILPCDFLQTLEVTFQTPQKGVRSRIARQGIFQGTIGCTPNSVSMVFIVFSSDSWGL